jgi:hypothetical protein
VIEGGRKVGPTETSVAEMKVPAMSHTVAQHPKEDLGAGATVKTANGEVKRPADVRGGVESSSRDDGKWSRSCAEAD